MASRRTGEVRYSSARNRGTKGSKPTIFSGSFCNKKTGNSKQIDLFSRANAFDREKNKKNLNRRTLFEDFFKSSIFTSESIELNTRFFLVSSHGMDLSYSISRRGI